SVPKGGRLSDGEGDPPTLPTTPPAGTRDSAERCGPAANCARSWSEARRVGLGSSAKERQKPGMRARRSVVPLSPKRPTKASPGLKVEIAGEPVVLLPERAILWPARNTLFVADLHWGKRETFVVEGMPLPDGLLEEELGLLDALVDAHEVKRIVVLGDLIHSREGLTPQVEETVARWRATGPAFLLVRGNHDRHVKRLPESWRIDESQDRTEPPFVLTHVPRRDPEGHVLAGHIHPALRLRGRGDGLRVPCFHVSPACTTLPAFSAFTGGAVVRKGQKDRAFAVTGDQVIEV
ncbi:MAG: ligase-associated DNA damage response endonuclease PdeM, partial [Myxococcota bacterium]